MDFGDILNQWDDSQKKSRNQRGSRFLIKRPMP